MNEQPEIERLVEETLSLETLPTSWENDLDRVLSVVERRMDDGFAIFYHTLVGNTPVMAVRFDLRSEGRAIVFSDGADRSVDVSMWTTDAFWTPVSNILHVGVVRQDDIEVLTRFLRIVNKGMERGLELGRAELEDWLEVGSS